MGGSPNQQFVDCCDFVVQFLFLSFRLFFFFFFIAHFSNRMKNKGGWGWPENGCRLQSPEFRGIFVFEKHAWFKWYPCNLIALFVNDICYARIISPWPVVLVPFFFLFFFPGNGIGKFGISMDETFFFFFLTPLSGNLEIPFYSTVHCLESWRNFFFFLLWRRNRTVRSVDKVWWTSVQKKKELKKNIVKLLFRFNIEEIII